MSTIFVFLVLFSSSSALRETFNLIPTFPEPATSLQEVPLMAF